MTTKREKEIKDCSRMINVFGQREMEIAAIKILDLYWQRPFSLIDPRIFEGDDLAIEGYRCLVEYKWIVDRTPTRGFWERVHGR